jgi:hypothetical protein
MSLKQCARALLLQREMFFKFAVQCSAWVMHVFMGEESVSYMSAALFKWQLE